MMAYTPLQLPKGTPHLIGHQIKIAIEPQLQAVHAMLRLPIETDSGLDADCHHAAVEVLLSVISGVSVVIYKPDKLESRGDRRRCFQSLLGAHFPWEHDVENAVVKLIWKWNHATESEVIIWSVKGDAAMPFSYEIDDADGVRKLAVCLENGLAGAVYMSAYCKFTEED